MSDAVGQASCIQHRAGCRYFTYYEDYQDIAPKQHADKIAAFLRVLEVKTNKQKIVNQEREEEARTRGLPLPKPSTWLEITYTDFVQYSLQTVGRSSFQIAEKEAEKLLFSKSRIVERHSRVNDPESPMISVKEYTLVRENVQAAIDGRDLPIVGDLFEKYPDIPPVEINTGSEGTAATSVENNKGAVDFNRGGVLKTTGGAVDFNSNKNKSNRTIKTKGKEAALTGEQEQIPSETPAAVATVLSLLKNLPEDQLHQLIQHLQPTPSGEIPPVAPGSSPQQASDIVREEMSASTETTHQENTASTVTVEPVIREKPALDAPRQADTVVALVEFLRKERYTPHERPRELRAAQRLLALQPPLSLAEIEEAWLHGSDDYWRRLHEGDEVHVHDLINQDSHGKQRVLAFLAHKRAQERQASAPSSGTHSRARGRTGGTAPSLSPATPAQAQPSQPKSSLSQEQAHALVERIAQQAAKQGYDLHGMPEPQGEGDGWLVRVSWHSLAWRGDLGLELRSEKQWEREFAEWQEVFAFRSRKGA